MRSKTTFGIFRLGCPLVLLVFPFVSVAGALDRPVARIYVSPKGDDGHDGSSKRPVRTIARGLACARDVRSDAPREVMLADGVWELEEPLRICSQDFEVTICAEHPGKAVISGGVRLSGWAPDESDPRFLVAKLPFKPAADTILSLTVGGESREVAVYPADGKRARYSGSGKTQLNYDPSEFPRGFDMDGVDLTSAWVTVPQEWASTSSRLASVDSVGHILTLANSTGLDLGSFNTGFSIHNVRIGLTKPGMWMYERGKVVYWPKPGETAENLVVIVSRLQRLVVLDHAQNLTLSGLVFTDTASSLAKPAKIWEYAAAVLAVISPGFTAKDCKVANCAGHGICMWKAARTKVTNCCVHDVGQCGIYFYDGGARGNEVRGNEVYRVGRLNPASAGIYMEIEGIQCIGNYVHDNPGNGLVLWSQFSMIAENRLDDNMLVQRDGGGLYGAYDYTVVRDNKCHYRKPSAWPALYADEGSQHTKITGNRVEGTGWATHVHCAQFCEVTGNTCIFDGTVKMTFQGSAHCTCKGNRICSARGYDNPQDLVSCDVWADNEVYVPGQVKGKFRKVKTLSVDIPRPPQYEAGRVVACSSTGIMLDGAGAEYPLTGYGLRRLVDGRDYVGCPSFSLKLAYDENSLYVYSGFVYSRFAPYSGRICDGHGWHCADGLRLVFGGGRQVTLYADGTVEANGLVVGKSDVAVKPSVDFRDTFGYELRVSLVSLGFKKGEPMAQKEMAFNAIAYNADHYEDHYLFAPVEGKELSGKLVFGGVR